MNKINGNPEELVFGVFFLNLGNTTLINKITY